MGVSRVIYRSSGGTIGEREQYSCGYRGEDGQAHSGYWPNTAYFCPRCGEVWAREVLQHEFEYEPTPSGLWVVEIRRCEEHGDGALLVGKSLEYCDAALLRRELNILLKEQHEY